MEMRFYMLLLWRRFWIKFINSRCIWKIIRDYVVWTATGNEYVSCIQTRIFNFGSPGYVNLGVLLKGLRVASTYGVTYSV